MKTPYSELKRDCQNLHNFTQEDIHKFISLVKINKDEKILDAMAGNGAIAKELSKINNINLYVLDKFEAQINEARKNINKAKFFVYSSLKMPFLDNFFDKIFIRNGVYEVPKNKQIELYKEIFRVLKNQGYFINWTFKLDKTNQKAFNELAKKKDEIAEFNDLAKNRYLATKEELENNLKQAGFSQIKFIDLGINYTISTKKWFEIDFKGDKEKYKKLNNYVKSLEIPGIEIKNLGKNGFEIKIPSLISIAKKE